MLWCWIQVPYPGGYSTIFRKSLFIPRQVGPHALVNMHPAATFILRLALCIFPGSLLEMNSQTNPESHTLCDSTSKLVIFAAKEVTPWTFALQIIFAAQKCFKCNCVMQAQASGWNATAAETNKDYFLHARPKGSIETSMLYRKFSPGLAFTTFWIFQLSRG